MRRGLLTCGLFALLIASAITLVGWCQSNTHLPLAKNREQLSALMRAKLSSTQKVVEGLMSGDYKVVSKGGDEILKICDATEWPAREDQVYAHYRAELRRAALKLIKQADEKSLEGAAYTYMHGMMTCINCHEYCRNVLRVASAVRPPRVMPIPVTDDEYPSSSIGSLIR